MIDLVKSIEDAMCYQDGLEGAIKTRADLERYEQIIADTGPTLIVETGTCAGGSALWFADTAGCPVVTIDVQAQLHANMVASWKGRVTMMYASSTDPETVAQVRSMAEPYERVMVVLDSDHTSGHVYREMVAYGPIVTPGCFMVVEDTLVRWMPWWRMGDGPLAAVEHYQERWPDLFVNDDEIEGISDRTQNIGGWLRRLGTPYAPRDQATCEHSWSSDLVTTWCDRCGMDHTEFMRQTDPDYQPPLMG